ncbi:hypothetical protein GCM10027265_18810 [Jatrophihabitans fulvus]
MNTLREGGRKLVHSIAPTALDSVSAIPGLRQRLNGVASRQDGQAAELRRLRQEVAELRSEIQEARRLHQRVAELTDLMGEVLLPAVARDDAKIAKALDEFAGASF